ncbi:radical SAM family heme chaperone HemW [Acetivibrio cellulolyticus]|uniref:radical SAM family heme chaperone HemW n=1 Tax=Acetivibrio cellulolyticus TaxID=35830 RepID=UPI0001E2C6C0|nr:radical SAM family heme chaperone HemW [Acetivibrio cellulolyticus]
MDNKKSIGIYIHIPFCRAKCFYCDFNSFACRDELVPAYFNALKKEISLYAEKLKGYNIKTVFIGGGTPSVVDAQYIYEIMSLLNQKLDIDKKAEISIETNPGTLNLEKLQIYKEIGVNRLSIGLQAWQDRILKMLGRIHTAKEFEDNFKLARQVGFDNINVDLIFGIPDQSFEDWCETLKSVTELGPEHMSCYSLKIEEGTIFGSRLENGELEPLDDDIDRKMYSYTKDYLAKKGYKHYEISNFAKPGYECRHNLVYWDVEEYIGIGAGSHSFFESTRFNNVYDIESYISSILGEKIPSENAESINKKESMAEFMILGLRLIDGVRVEDFKSRFGVEIYSVYGKEINRLVDWKLIIVKEGFISLSSIGLDYANQVFMEFI